MQKEFIWSELKTIKELDYSLAASPGVYIWGFSISSQFIPYYVGIAQNIGRRIIKHSICITSGEYTIFDKAYLHEYYKSKKNRVIGTGAILYEPKWPESYIKFIQEKEKLQPHIDFMIDSFTFSFAKTPEATGNDLKVFEKYFINKIGIDKLINTRAGNCGEITVTNKGCFQLIELLNSNY